MKKYSFLTEAFPSDYNKNTFGDFYFLFSGNDLNNIVNRINKQNFKLNYVSKKKGQLSSIYYMNPNRTQLLRVSDHWSKSNIEGVKQVGYIGNCIWNLYSDKVKKCNDKYQIGIIDMIKLRKI
jgi:hypothetical protein